MEDAKDWFHDAIYADSDDEAAALVHVIGKSRGDDEPVDAKDDKSATDGGEDPYAALSPRTRRKRKNRDQMRAARQRERETMDRLRRTVERLEVRYQEMQHQKEHQDVPERTLAPPVATSNNAHEPQAYVELLAVSSQLKEENFHLKQTLHEKHKLQETLERVVTDHTESTRDTQELLRLSDQFQGSTAIASTPAKTLSGEDAPGSHWADSFNEIPEEEIWKRIAGMHQEMAHLRGSMRDRTTSATIVVDDGRSSMSPLSEDDLSSSGTESPSPSAPLPSFCGWDVRHRIQGTGLFFTFEKAFTHMTAYNAMDRMWLNERGMQSYRDRQNLATQSLHIVQNVNDDTYIFQRRMLHPSTRRPVITTYLRFRQTSPQGFIIGSTSINDLQDAAVWAAQLLLWTEFIPLAGNGGCIVRMTGRTNLDSPANAHRYVAEVIVSLLRWENLNIGPMFTLTAT
ncbi:hypothetical protein Poli38472_007219 [Pythium oligandrum]|uniref:BZIP domain-containing protein n=1 Tax=Pythium oligandrum TaxID=41045 RepID=A0A8K1C9R5_PYTOL|nr:hypothetical protein Poli38472_007219 [Pythium oligandrum]|eukprot:TMW59074.1 hypothetical protein Poli38472_007219 [Pythium oligandrum]